MITHSQQNKSYLIGLWFSLRTHASQIWQNPQQLMHPFDLTLQGGHGRTSLYTRLLQSATNNALPIHQTQSGKAHESQDASGHRSGSQTPVHRHHDEPTGSNTITGVPPVTVTGADPYSPTSPITSSQRQAAQHEHAALADNLVVDQLSRALVAATASALRAGVYPQSPSGPRHDGPDGSTAHGGHGHDAPSWSRTTSASVLLACTALYAAIAGWNPFFYGEGRS